MVPPPRPQRNAFQLQREDNGGRRNTSTNTDMLELGGFAIPVQGSNGVGRPQASSSSAVQHGGFSIPLVGESSADEAGSNGTVSHGGFAIPMG